MDSLGGHAGDGTVGVNPMMTLFSEGNVVLLQSLASKRRLCVKHGRVSGTGIRDPHSQFVVYIRRYGRIALQNVASPNTWLQIRDGETRAGRGQMEFAEFNVHEVGDSFVALESAVYPGQHVGIREDGELKSAAETPPMDPSSFFIPFLHSSASGSAGLSQSQNPRGSRQRPNQQRLPPGWEAARTADGREYFINHTTRATSWTSPALDPAPPTGYSIQDLCVRGNSVLIVPVLATKQDYDCAMTMQTGDALLSVRSYPKWVASATNTGPDYANANCIVTPTVMPEGGIMLKTHCGMVWVNNAKKVFVMKNPLDRGKNELFIVHHIRESIVAFESALFPGYFLSVDGPGRPAILEAVGHRALGFTQLHVQFIVRVMKFESNPRQRALSPFSGKVASVEKLVDGAVVQFYHRPSQLFLGVHGTEVTLIDDEEDNKTHWEYHDRGMGRLSLSLRGADKTLSMGHNGALCTVPGFGSVKSSDFRVLECPTGELILQSSRNTGDYVSLWSSKYRIKVQKFSVYLLDMSGSSKLTPRDAIN